MEGMGTGTDMVMGMGMGLGMEEADRRNQPRWPSPESTSTHI